MYLNVFTCGEVKVNSVRYDECFAHTTGNCATSRHRCDLKHGIARCQVWAP